MITVHSIAEEIKLRYDRINTPARINNGQWEYLISKNVWIPQEVFDRMRPAATYVPRNIKGENSDRSKGWIKNQKSY